MLEPCMGFIAWRSPAASSPACESAILGPPFAVSGQLIPLGQTTSYWEATTASAAVHTGKPGPVDFGSARSWLQVQAHLPLSSGFNGV
jgi:hypothetical protein